jgi:type I restriction enzyme S subunit
MSEALGHVCTFLNGGTPSTSVPRYFEGTIPWITGADIVGPTVESARSFITEEAIQNSATNRVPAGTVLLVTRTSVGKVAVAGTALCFSQDITALIPNPQKLDTSYLVQFLHTKVPHFERLSRGATIKGITREVVADLPVLLPPLPEQRRIAEILDRAEEIRAKRRAALAQLDTLTQAIFLDIFGNPATNTKDWPRKSLKALGKVTTGGTPPSAMDGMFNGPIPFVTPGDLERDEPVKRSLTNAGAEESVTVRAGAAFVCCIGATIGKMAKARERSAFNQQINAVEWTREIDDRYGLAVLRFFKPTIVAWGASTTLPILKKSTFEKIEVPVPPLPLQHEFACRVEAMEKLKTAHSASLMEMDALFASLQHRAFRGEL